MVWSLTISRTIADRVFSAGAWCVSPRRLAFWSGAGAENSRRMLEKVGSAGACCCSSEEVSENMAGEAGLKLNSGRSMGEGADMTDCCGGGRC